jgi:cell division protein FtsI/penicillin-binding protein 2
MGARLVWLHHVSGPAFAEMAEAQRLRDIEVAPRRGTIYDRDGQPLAVTVEARTIYAVPSAVVDPEGVAEALAGVLGGEPEEYLECLTRDCDFAYVERKADVEAAQALEELDLAGIGFLDDFDRRYPGGDLACHVLGFVGVDDAGLAGLEQYYDELLAGVPGRVMAERDPFGRVIPGGVVTAEDPQHGQSIVLTIDKDIQYRAEAELEAAIEKAGARGGSVVVMDPTSGEILAMASTPRFDPNEFSSSPPSSFRNRPVTDVYEPGSTMKPFTAAAALEAGLYGPDEVFYLPPTIEVGGRTIHESHSRKPVKWTLRQIVANSSNVGAVTVAQDIGEQALYDALVRYGFSSRTGVDFPGEGVGVLPAPEQWSASTIGNLPFGQGMSVTPLQLARGLAVIANGGELVTPHFLKSQPNEDASELEWPTTRSMTATAAAEMREMLALVVTDGTGSAAAVPGYTVAGKTGTAQKPRTDGRGYAAGKYIASFAGFLPAEDPRVLVVVMLDEPSNGYYGGPLAGPAFANIASFAASQLRVAPVADEPDPSDVASEAAGG